MKSQDFNQEHSTVYVWFIMHLPKWSKWSGKSLWGKKIKVENLFAYLNRIWQKDVKFGRRNRKIWKHFNSCKAKCHFRTKVLLFFFIWKLSFLFLNTTKKSSSTEWQKVFTDQTNHKFTKTLWEVITKDLTLNQAMQKISVSRKLQK